MADPEVTSFKSPNPDSRTNGADLPADMLEANYVLAQSRKLERKRLAGGSLAHKHYLIYLHCKLKR